MLGIVGLTAVLLQENGGGNIITCARFQTLPQVRQTCAGPCGKQWKRTIVNEKIEL
jgi:hypothetical protein